MATLEAAANALLTACCSGWVSPQPIAARASLPLLLILLALLLGAAAAGCYLWRLVRLGFPVRCWFCSGVTRVPFGNRSCFDCPHCDQYNGFDSTGDYNKDIPAMRHSTMNLQQRHQQHQPRQRQQRPIGESGGGGDGGVLCDACNRNQALKVAELAQFEPSSPAAEDAELAALRARLERAYALCQRCRGRRRATLQAQDLRLLPGLLTWQKARVLQQQRKRGTPASSAAGSSRLLRVSAICLAVMGTAAAVSAEAARFVCAPAAVYLVAGLCLRCRSGGGGRIRFRACDLWHGPAFFAAAEPLRTRLAAAIAEVVAFATARIAQPVVSAVPAADAASAPLAGSPPTWLLVAVLALPHAVAFALNWRLASSEPHRGLRNNSNNSQSNNNNNSQSDSSISEGTSRNNIEDSHEQEDEDNFDSASAFAQPPVSSAFGVGFRLQQPHQKLQCRPQPHFRQFQTQSTLSYQQHQHRRPASLPPTATLGSSSWSSQQRPMVRSFNLFPQQQHNNNYLPPPPPPSTPTPMFEAAQEPSAVRPRSRSRSPSRRSLQTFAPSPMDVDDDVAFGGSGGAGSFGGANNCDDAGGGADSAYASQRASVADLPSAAGLSAATPAAAVAAGARRGRLAQVLIGCCLGVNFSLLLHCLLLPVARTLLATAGRDGWEAALRNWIFQ